MANIKKLKANGQDIVPVTHEQAVLDSNGVTLESKLNAINNAISRLENNSTSNTPSLVGNALTFGNYTIKYNETDDTLDFIYNGVIDDPDVPTTEEVVPLTWAVGNLSSSGAEKPQDNSLRSDFVTIVSGSTYSFYLDTSFYDPSGVRVYFYDTNKTYISRTDGNVLGYTTGTNISIDTPSNAAYMRFKANASGTTSVDTVSSLFTLKKRKTAMVNNYVTEGLSMYIDATQGSVRDITGNYTITNHGVTHTSDNNYLNFVSSESDYLDTDLLPNLSTWSTEVYFHFTNSTPADSQNIYCWGNSSSNRVRVGYSGTEKCMTVLVNSTKQKIGDISLTLQHLVVTANNGTYTVYINGVQQYTFSSGTLSSSTNNMVIGTSSYSTGNFPDMNLKIFRHYDGKVLTPEEVLQNYNYETNRNDEVVSVTWIDGKTISNGNIVDNATAMLSDPITIDNNYNYTIRYNPTTTNQLRIVFYDSSQTFISKTDYLTTGNVDTVITFPENTAYFRIKVEKVGITVNEANDNIIIKKVAK